MGTKDMPSKPELSGAELPIKIPYLKGGIFAAVGVYGLWSSLFDVLDHWSPIQFILLGTGVWGFLELIIELKPHKRFQGACIFILFGYIIVAGAALFQKSNPWKLLEISVCKYWSAKCNYVRTHRIELGLIGFTFSGITDGGQRATQLTQLCKSNFSAEGRKDVEAAYFEVFRPLHSGKEASITYTIQSSSGAWTVLGSEEMPFREGVHAMAGTPKHSDRGGLIRENIQVPARSMGFQAFVCGEAKGDLKTSPHLWDDITLSEIDVILR